MKAFISGRQGGKTTKLIEWFIDNPGSVILCYSQSERLHIANQIGQMNVGINVKQALDRLYTFGTARVILAGSQPKVYVDNVDLLLRNMFGPNVEGFSATGSIES